MTEMKKTQSYKTEMKSEKTQKISFVFYSKLKYYISIV